MGTGSDARTGQAKRGGSGVRPDASGGRPATSRPRQAAPQRRRSGATDRSAASLPGRPALRQACGGWTRQRQSTCLVSRRSWPGSHFRRYASAASGLCLCHRSCERSISANTVIRSKSIRIEYSFDLVPLRDGPSDDAPKAAHCLDERVMETGIRPEGNEHVGQVAQDAGVEPDDLAQGGPANARNPAPAGRIDGRQYGIQVEFDTRLLPAVHDHPQLSATTAGLALNAERRLRTCSLPCSARWARCSTETASRPRRRT
jgi:hypothetical protein